MQRIQRSPGNLKMLGIFAPECVHTRNDSFVDRTSGIFEFTRMRKITALETPYTYYEFH